ncbi:hypothetical protein [Pontibacter roseus]|uniref:hypothetical protein n=1 Tax=Pontibacter roseus TaxID=336989 RepID=UPI00037141E6|nr:hypothetical protein [Pontibacter roseus]
MTKGLRYTLFFVGAITLLTGCGTKEADEIEVTQPRIQAPATFKLAKTETGAVEVYTKDGKVTGAKATHMGGSAFYFNNIVSTTTELEFVKPDTVIAAYRYDRPYSESEHHRFKYRSEYTPTDIVLHPYNLSKIIRLAPEASSGYELVTDPTVVAKEKQLFVQAQQDTLLTITQYEQVFQRMRWNGGAITTYTRNNDQDKALYQQFTEVDTLWIRKKTFSFRKVKG